MSLIFNTSFDSLQKKSDKLLSNIGFSTEPASISKLFMSIVNSEISDFYTLLDEKHAQAFLSTSSGGYLDRIGYLLNCNRQPGENDDNYKARISKRILIVESSNEYCILQALNNIDGVANVYLKNYVYGPGSFAVIITGTDTYGNLDDIINQAYNKLNEVVAYGTKFIIQKPIDKYIKLSINLSFNKNIDDIQYNALINKAENEIKKYINSLSLSKSFIPNELIKTIMNVDDVISNISFDKFYINNEQVDFIEQKTRWNERFLVSPDVDAITFD